MDSMSTARCLRPSRGGRQSTMSASRTPSSSRSARSTTGPATPRHRPRRGPRRPIRLKYLESHRRAGDALLAAAAEREHGRGVGLLRVSDRVDAYESTLRLGLHDVEAKSAQPGAELVDVV